MKALNSHQFNPKMCRNEWKKLSKLVKSKNDLSEQKEVLPLFKSSPNLSLLICTYFPKVKTPNLLASEYQIQGDFVADLVVGDSNSRQFLLIEFESGTPMSIFKKKKSKATPDWAPRFESAYSQIIDWLWKLEDMRSTQDFSNTFGDRRATFQALIVIGKSMKLAKQEEDRLRWRTTRTLIDSNPISVVSFEGLLEDLDHWLKVLHGV